MTQPSAVELADRVALVTGASSGIGRATALELAAAGARVGLAARTESALADLAATIEDTGGSAHVVPTDLRSEDQVVSMVESTHEAFGRLDILVNNAGVGYWDPIAEADRDAWRQELEVNLLGLMFATHVAVPILLEQGSGHVVNVSSLSGRYPGPEWPSYSASKFGVRGFTGSILRDLREDGLRVTMIEPGEVDTPMQEAELRGAEGILGPADVADAIVYAVTRPEHVCVNDIQLIPTRPIDAD